LILAKRVRAQAQGIFETIMTTGLEQLFDPPFRIRHPESGPAALLFNSPHSGRIYPEAFLAASRLDPLALRRSEDMDVDHLFADVIAAGASLMTVEFPRAYCDVNREPYELDPKMFAERLPPYVNTASLRVASGLGTIPRTVGDGQDIYRGSLPIAEAFDRIECLYKPYHRALSRQLTTAHRRYGFALLVDCHSMPSAAVTRSESYRCDIVIGDRFGTSADPDIPDRIEAYLRHCGYQVARNRPYAGGFITEHHGAPATGIHALQIEVNRALYMDERRMERLPNFERLRMDLAGMAHDLADLVSDFIRPERLAAE
jgi:N-formylglutamate amidohydrolase